MATPTKPKSRLGTYVVKTFKDESFRAYVPPPLPPDPPLAVQPLLPSLEQANQALGCLDGLASILPDPSLFIYLYVRKEAVLSSQIEGTQSSFSDLMLFESTEAPSVPLEDVQEVSNYVAAMNHGLGDNCCRGCVAVFDMTKRGSINAYPLQFPLHSTG